MIRAAKQNLPVWRGPWIDTATGKQKSGFWQVRYNGRYWPLTRYGAPIHNKNDRDFAKAVSARDAFLKEHSEQQAVAQEQERMRSSKKLLVADVLNFVIEKQLPKLAPGTRKEKLRHLLNFATGGDGGKPGINAYKGFGRLEWDQLNEEHIDKWVEAHPRWNNLKPVDAVRSAFAFAVKKGLIAHNPVVQWEPDEVDTERFQYQPREAYFQTDAEVKFFRQHARPAEFLCFFDANLELGTRPGEIAALRTHNVKTWPEGLFWRLEPHEWKNGRKIKRPRVIMLTPKWEAWAKKRLDEVKSGDHLFLNSDGFSWDRSGWRQAFNRAKAQAKKDGSVKLDDGLVMNSCRHTFITKAILKGVEISHLAEACGTSEYMIRRTYSHILREFDALRRSVVFAVNDLA